MMKPRLRFSLKAILVLFTIVAVWLGWNASIVHQRKTFLALLEEGDCYAMTSSPALSGQTMHSYSMIDVYAANAVGHPTKYSSHGRRLKKFTMPTLRCWMGDKRINLIAYRPGPELSEVQRIFPEATILLIAPEKPPNK